MRKVEFNSNKNHNHDANLEVCPLCHSPLSPKLSPIDSSVQILAAESPLQLESGQVIEIKGETND